MKYLNVLFLILAFSGCRTDPPPKLSLVCIGDGFGGADCVTSAGANQYMSPSQLKDFWMTTQTDEANYTSWCYQIPKSTATKALATLKNQIKMQ